MANPTREDFIRQFRAENPSLAYWTDDDVLDGYAEQLSDRLDEFPVLAEHAQRRRMADTNLFAEAKGALGAGVDQFQGKLYDTAALVGDAAGIDSLKNWGREGYERNKDEASNYDPVVRSFEGVRTPSDFAYWLTNITANNAPQLAGTAAAAVGAVVAAPAIATAAGVAAPTAGLAAAIGGGIAGFTQMQNYGELSELGGENVVPLAVANGLIGAALEAMPVAGQLSRVLGKSVGKEAVQGAVTELLRKHLPGQLVNVALTAAKEGRNEMLTEMLQESSSIVSEMVSNRNNPEFELDDSQVKSRLINSATAGFFLGGGLSVGMSAMQSKDRTPTSDPKQAVNLADQITRPETPLMPVVPTAKPTPVAAPVVAEAPAAPASPQAIGTFSNDFQAALAARSTVGVAAPATSGPAAEPGEVLATVDQQRLLVELGIPQSEAMQLSVERATELILEGKAARDQAEAKAIEAKRAADEKAAAELRRVQEAAAVARQQQIAAEQEILEERMAEEAEAAQAEAAELARGMQLMGDGTLADLRFEAQQGKAHDAAWGNVNSWRRAAAKARAAAGTTTAALNAPEAKTAPVAPNTLATETVATGPVEHQTLNIANVPNVTAAPSVATPSRSEPAAEPRTPPISEPTSAPSTVSPAPTVEPTHGLTGLGSVPLSKVYDYGVLPLEKAARPPKGADRWLAFETPGGNVGLARLNSRGNVAVRENMAATSKTIAEALKVLPRELGPVTVSVGSVEKVLKGGTLKDKATVAKILDEAKRQGYSRGAFGENVSPQYLVDKGYVFIGAVDAPKGSKMKDLMTLTRAEYDSATKQASEQPAASTPVAPAKAIEVAAPAVAPTTAREALPVAVAAPVVAASDNAPAQIKYIPSDDAISGLVSSLVKQVGSWKKTEALFNTMTESKLLEGVATVLGWGKSAKALKLQAEARLAIKQMTPSQRSALANAYRERLAGIVELQKAALMDADRAAKSVEDDKLDTEEIIDKSDLGNGFGIVSRLRVFAENYLTPDSDITAKFDGIVEEGAYRGVRIVQSEAKSEMKAGGAYNPSNRTVMLALKNVFNPTQQELLGLIHELVHDTVEGQPDWVKTVIHDAFERLPQGENAYYQNSKADPRVRSGENTGNLDRETYMMERAVEHASLFGVDATYSRSVFATVWRLLKDYLLRAAMYVQTKFVGAGNVSGAMAKAYVENVAARIVAQDVARLSGFAAQFGRTPTMGSVQKFLPGSNGTVNRVEIDPKTGTPKHEFSGDLSRVAARHNIEGVELSMQENLAQNQILSEAEARKELDQLVGSDTLFRDPAQSNQLESFQQAIRTATTNAEVTVAVSNHWGAVLEKMYAQLAKQFPMIPQEDVLSARRAGRAVADGLTPERFRSILRTLDPKELSAEAMAQLRVMLENQLGKKVNLDELGLDMAKTIDDLPELQKGLADDKVLEQATRFSAKVGNRLSAVADEIAKVNLDIEKTRVRIVEITNRLADFKMTERETSTLVAEYLQEFARSLRSDVRETTREVRGAAAVLEQLEATVEDQSVIDSAGKLRGDLQSVQRIINNVDVPNLPLLSIFRELFALEATFEFDLADATPRTIRDAVIEHVRLNSDSALANLVEVGEGPDATVRGTALLSSVIAFAKHQAVVTDALRLQFSKAQDRAQQIIEVRDALKETNEARIDELRQAAIKNRKRPGQRVIQSLLNERDNLLREQRHMANLEQEVVVLRRTLPVFEDARSRSVARLGAFPYWAPTPGASILNPPRPDTDAREVVGRPLVLTMSREAFIGSEQMQEVMRNQAAWLTARENSPDFVADQTYNLMKYQHTMLGRMAVDSVVDMVDGVSRGALLHGPGEQAIRTGTPAGRVLARLIQSVETWKRAQKAEDVRLGKEWENAADGFLKLARVEAEWAHNAMYDTGMDFMNSERALGEDAGFDALRKLFRERGGLVADIAGNDTQWKAFTKWLQVSNRINQREMQRSLEVGNRVRDDKIGFADKNTGKEVAALRSPVRQGVYTTGGRHLTSRVLSILHGMKDRAVLRGDGQANPFADAALRLQTDPESVRTAWANLIKDGDFLTHVIDPLMLNLKATLPTPDRMDGIVVPMNPSIAHEAWQQSGRDILEFSRLVYQRLGETGSTEDLVKYQTKLLNYIGAKVNTLFGKADEVYEHSSSARSGIAHVAMDARESSDFPSEWLTYPTYSRDDLNHSTHLIAVNGYLGRNLELLDGLSKSIETDLAGVAKHMPQSGAAREELKTTNPKLYAYLDKAVKLHNNYKGDYFANTVRKILDPERGATGDFGPVLEFYQLAIVGMLSGLRTSLRDLSSLTRPFQMEKSVSRETLKAVGGNVAFASRNLLAAVFNSLTGSDLLKSNPYIRLAEKAGLEDPARWQDISEQFKGTRGKNDSLDMSATGRVTRVLRMMRNAASYGRLGFNKGASGPALRVNPFPFFSQLQVFSGMETYMRRVADLGAAAGEFYRSNPDKVGKTLTAADLGYSDANGFATLRDVLAFNGVSLEAIGERVSKLSDPKLEDILDDNTVRGIGSFIMSNQLIESSPNDRPVWTQTNKFARASSMLVGWSLANTAQVFDIMRDPQRRMSVKSVFNGTKVMMLGMLPAAVAVSLLIDWYDEELTEKKSNQTPLSTDWLGSTLERATNLGTLGLAGELGMAVFGNRDGAGTRALSVDQRIVWVSAIQQMLNSFQTLSNAGWDNVNYANFWRPLMGTVGAGGTMQNIQLFNGLFGSQDMPLFRDEADVTSRINVNNWLRVAGREIGLEVRKTGTSMGVSTTNPATPWITNMVLASLANDTAAFQEAYRGAVKAAENIPAAGNDPRAYVVKTFAGRNPLKQVFAVSPSTSEVQLLLRSMPEDGRAAVMQAINHFNRFSQALGAPAFMGSAGADTKALIRAQARAVGLPSNEATVQNIRAAMAARRAAESDE